MSGRRHKSVCDESTLSDDGSAGTGSPYGGARLYVGGLSSLASQPRASEIMGSSDTTVVLWPHLWHSNVRVPCVDGSELARAFFTFAALVGAAMCSAF